MSDHAPIQQNLPPGIELQDNEHIEWNRIVMLTVAALVVFAIGVVYALWLLNHDTHAITQQGTGIPALLKDGCAADPNDCAQVGIVEVRPMELEQRAQQMKKDAAHRLETYGWIDEAKGITHIPVGEAMKKVAEGERAQ